MVLTDAQLHKKVAEIEKEISDSIFEIEAFTKATNPYRKKIKYKRRK